ncbi:hypothetical protein D3C75_1108720 [compost metagenome]
MFPHFFTRTFDSKNRDEIRIIVRHILADRFAEYIRISLHIEQIVFDLKRNPHMVGKFFEGNNFRFAGLCKHSRHDQTCLEGHPSLIKANHIQLLQGQTLAF